MVVDDKLKNEVLNLFSQGLTNTQVKSKLLEQGNSIETVNQAMQEAFTHKEKKKNNIPNILMGIAIVCLAIILIYLIFFNKEKIVSENLTFSSYPGDWVDKNDSTSNIDVFEATEGKGTYLGSEQYVDYDGDYISLYLLGAYFGKDFEGTYLINDSPVFRLQKDMKPTDGVIEAFSILKRENTALKLYVFVDEDWKQRANGRLNIVWSENFQNNSEVFEKPFNFDLVKNGVYVDYVDTNIAWIKYQNPIYGRVFVGEITKQDIENNDFNKTFVMIT